MNPGPVGTVHADVIESLRANPVLASLSEEGLSKIADVVVQETQVQVAAALRSVELFEGLSEEDFDRIQSISEPVVLDSDTTLYEEGDASDRFFVVVRGAVELSAVGEGASISPTVLRAGQAFGDMALLNEAPRSASARVTEQSYLIGIARDAFLETLGPESLASRLLRNLSKALSAARARSEAGGGEARAETPREALLEYNRMVRGRLLPRGTPTLGGYDLAGTTVTEEGGDASAAWDWFLLSDGRLALAVLKADQQSLSAAHRLLAARGLLRDFADDPLPGLGALLTRVNRGLRAGWVEGISGSVSCGIIALSDDGVEWASAGGAAGTVVRADGSHEDLIPDEPALGSDEKLEYRSMRLRLQPGDHLLAFSEGPSDSVIVGRKFLASKGRYAGARERLDALVRRVRESSTSAGGVFEVTAAFVERTESSADAGPRSGSDAVARAAEVFDTAAEDEPTGDR